MLHAHKEFMKVAEQMVTDIVQKHEKEPGTKHAKEMKNKMKKEIKIKAKGHLDIVVRGGIDRYARIYGLICLAVPLASLLTVYCREPTIVDQLSRAAVPHRRKNKNSRRFILFLDTFKLI